MEQFNEDDFFTKMMIEELRKQRAIAFLTQYPAMLECLGLMRKLGKVSIAPEDANLFLEYGILEQDERGVFISDFVEDILDEADKCLNP